MKTVRRNLLNINASYCDPDNDRQELDKELLDRFNISMHTLLFNNDKESNHDFKNDPNAPSPCVEIRRLAGKQQRNKRWANNLLVDIITNNSSGFEKSDGVFLTGCILYSVMY